MDNGRTLITDEELLLAAGAQQPTETLAGQESGGWDMHNNGAQTQSGGKCWILRSHACSASPSALHILARCCVCVVNRVQTFIPV